MVSGPGSAATYPPVRWACVMVSIQARQQDMGEVWAEFAPDRPAEPSLFDAMREALEAASQVPEPDDFGTAER
jgi:hypothetical protein